MSAGLFLTEVNINTVCELGGGAVSLQVRRRTLQQLFPPPAALPATITLPASPRYLLGSELPVCADGKQNIVMSVRTLFGILHTGSSHVLSSTFFMCLFTSAAV